MIKPILLLLCAGVGCNIAGAQSNVHVSTDVQTSVPENLIISQLENRYDLNKQEEAIRAVAAHPERYKSVLMEYLKSRSELDKAQNPPSEAVLYSVGFTRDKDYFKYLYGLLKTDYAKDQCIYYCGVVFASMLTCPDIKYANSDTGTSAPLYDFSEGLKKFINSKPKDLAARKAEAEKYLPTMPNGKQDVAFLDYPMDKLLMMMRDNRTDFEKQLNAAIIVNHMATDMRVAVDLLVLSIQGRKDAADEFKGNCDEGIRNILVQNKKNFLAGSKRR